MKIAVSLGAAIGSILEYFGKNGLHRPLRSTAREIPVMKAEIIE